MSELGEGKANARLFISRLLFSLLRLYCCCCRERKAKCGNIDDLETSNGGTCVRHTQAHTHHTTLEQNTLPPLTFLIAMSACAPYGETYILFLPWARENGRHTRSVIDPPKTCGASKNAYMPTPPRSTPTHTIHLFIYIHTRTFPPPFLLPLNSLTACVETLPPSRAWRRRRGGRRQGARWPQPVEGPL